MSFDVTNSGKRAGSEVAQIYIADPTASVPRPPKELKGFVKVSLKPGETQRLTVALDTRSFAYYDAVDAVWRAPAGNYKVLVGESSEQIELSRDIKLARALADKP